MLNKFWFFILFLVTTFVYADPGSDLLIGYDQLSYNPIDNVSKSVSFKMTIDGLEEELNKVEKYGKFEKIIFNITRDKKDKIDIKIDGIKGEFNDLRQSLKNKITPYLEIIFPSSLSKSFRGYSLTLNQNKLQAVDKTYLKPIKESYMVFEKNGSLLENKIKTSQGTQIITFEYVPSRKNKNQIMMSNIKRKVIYGPNHLLTNTAITYDSVNGIDFPKNITTEFIFESQSDKKENMKENKLVERYDIFGVELR